MRWLLAAAILSLMVASASAVADGEVKTAGDLLTTCQHHDEASLQECFGAIDASVLVTGMMANMQQVCIFRAGDAGQFEMRDVVRDYVSAHPERKDERVDAVVADALRDRYPCTKSTSIVMTSTVKAQLDEYVSHGNEMAVGAFAVLSDGTDADADYTSHNLFIWCEKKAADKCGSQENAEATVLHKCQTLFKHSCILIARKEELLMKTEVSNYVCVFGNCHKSTP